MSDPEPSSPNPTDGTANKPLPTAPASNGRPGTSGTELGLRSNREKATSALQRAQKAEATYRAKRRAQYARKDYEAAKDHFRIAGRSLKEGSKCMWSAVIAGPAIVSEKMDKAKQGKEVKDREKAEEKRRLWEEKAKKKDVATDGEDAASPAPEEPMATPA